MIARILIVAALQIAALVAMIGDRMNLLASGREVILPVIPVDPSDPFRGDYVTLTYDISQIQGWDVTNDGAFFEGDTIFVAAQPSADPKKWEVVAISHNKPAGVQAAAVLFRGTVISAYRQDSTSTEAWAQEGKPDFVPPLSEKPKHLCPGGCPVLQVQYGIESFFVQQGTGRPIEEQRNDGLAAVKLAVDDNGRAAIKSLLVDGKPVAEETLF